MALEQFSDGLNVTVTSALEPTDRRVIATFQDGHIPLKECGDGYTRCPLNCEGDPTRYMCKFPFRNGSQNYQAIVQFGGLTSENGVDFVKTELLPVPADGDCVPIETFDRGQYSSYRYFVACLSHRSGRLIFLELHLDKDNISNAELVHNSDEISHDFYLIPGENTSISRLLFRADRESFSACSVTDNVFFKVGPEVVAFEFRETPVFRSAAELINCPNTLSISLFQHDHLRVQCSNDHSILVGVCVEEEIHYNRSLNGSLYRCSEAYLNVSLVGRVIKVQSRVAWEGVPNITLTFNDTRDAVCVGKTLPTLFIARDSGETVAVDLKNGLVTHVANNSCINDVCLAVDTLETKNGYIVGVFDYDSNQYVVFNTSCPSSPISPRLHY